MATALSAHGITPEGFLVQEMVPAGVEMIVGVVHDPQFGPVIACGAGGVLVELLRIGSLVEDLPQIVELDCNPIMVLQRGAAVIDARVRVAPYEPPPLAAARGET